VSLRIRKVAEDARRFVCLVFLIWLQRECSCAAIKWFVCRMNWDNQKIENRLASATITLAMKVHSRFGPGLLESAYRECLAYELRKAGHKIEIEKSLPLIYESVRLNHGYRMDLLLDEKLVVELKSVEFITDVHLAQVMTYLKVGDYRLGLLINFKVAHLKDGIKRVVNKL